MAATVSAASKEYIHGPVTASVVLDTQTVEIAFTAKTASVDDTTAWVPAEWEGDPGTTRSWRLLIGPGTATPLSPGVYQVWVRVTDVTEAPVRKHDLLTII